MSRFMHNIGWSFLWRTYFNESIRHLIDLCGHLSIKGSIQHTEVNETKQIDRSIHVYRGMFFPVAFSNTTKLLKWHIKMPLNKLINHKLRLLCCKLMLLRDEVSKWTKKKEPKNNWLESTKTKNDMVRSKCTNYIMWMKTLVRLQNSIRNFALFSVVVWNVIGTR